MVQNRLIATNSTCVGRAPEDHTVGRRGRRLNTRAIPHASQERLIGEILFIKICGEDDELFKRNLNLLSGVKRQVIDTTLERNDPSIEKVLRSYALPPKI